MEICIVPNGFRTFQLSNMHSSHETITIKADIAPLNEARTNTPQESPAIPDPHSYMAFFLPLVFTGHVEDNTDMRNIKKNVNIAQ